MAQVSWPPTSSRVGPLVVQSRGDLPAADVDGKIHLAAGSWVCVHGDVDLGGDSLIADGVVSLCGSSAETASLTSAGLPAGRALIESQYSMPIQNLKLSAPSGAQVFNMAGSGGAQALDFFACNVEDSQIGGVAVSDTPVPDTFTRATTNGVGRVESVPIVTSVTLNPGDYLEVWVENRNNTQNITVESGSLHVG